MPPAMIDLPPGTVPAGLGGAQGPGTGVGHPGGPDLREGPRVTNGSPLVAIGDLHGNLQETKVLWSKVAAHMGEDALARAEVVFLGDYCDRGPDTRGLLDWLIALRDSRAEGATHFIAGNHDLGFAAFVGSLPIDDPQNPPLDLESTRDPRFTTGFWPHPVDAPGMHYQGRRWANGRTYNSHSTFSSYGLELDGSPEMRQRLVAVLPPSHADFLRRMRWIHVAERTWGSVICVHAGLDSRAPLEPQLQALEARDLSASCLHDKGTDSGRLIPLCNRQSVEPIHPQLAGRALLVSGHHGFSKLDDDRIILDASGGVPGPGRPIQAIVLPARTVIGSE
jgi:hypothetical protein